MIIWTGLTIPGASGDIYLIRAFSRAAEKQCSTLIDDINDLPAAVDKMERTLMAMNKAEKKQLEDVQVEAAFSWPKEAEPKQFAIMAWREEQRALGKEFYLRNNAKVLWTYIIGRAVGMWGISGAVEIGCSDGHSHSIGRTDRTDRQTAGGPWYETEADAYLALRWELCRNTAAKLRQIDVMREQAHERDKQRAAKSGEGTGDATPDRLETQDVSS